MSELDTHVDEEALGTRARSGFAWSIANSTVRRVWTFALGIILARLLAPADFGVYAIALASLTIMQSMNDLGVAVALIRWQGDPEKPAKTATTISIGVSLAMYAVVFVLAPMISDLLDAPSATAVIRLLTLAVVIDGFSGIPNAFIEREFLQRSRLVADFSAIAVNAAVAIALATSGFGPMALAWGIVAGNLVGTIIIIAIAPSRPLPGFDKDDARALLKVGLPLAGASLLVFVMLNVDYIVIGGVLEATALGFYLLAFNLSSWPPNLLTVAVRSVSIPAFSQLASSRERLFMRFIEIFGLLMTFTLPVVTLLAVLSTRVITVVYGQKWEPAATVLSILAALGAMRVALDLCYDLLVAIGESRTVMRLQLLWVAALIPAIIVGARVDGIRGAAFAHVAVAALIVGPSFARVLGRLGVSLPALASSLRRPLIGAIVMVGAVVGIDHVVANDFVALVVGGVTGVIVYAGVVTPWHHGRPDLRAVLRLTEPSVGTTRP